MEFWTYSTEWSSVEEIGLLFNTLEEAKDHSLKQFLNQSLDREDWKHLTSYYKFKLV